MNMKKIVFAFLIVSLASCKGGDKVNSLDQNADKEMVTGDSKKQEKDRGTDKVQVKVIEDENSLSRKVIILADPYEFSEQIEAPVQLVDVRTPQEYAGGKISNAVNIDFRAADFADKIQGMKKDETIYIYCQSGNRSGQAAMKMKELGFTKIYDLDGGYLKWKELGL